MKNETELIERNRQYWQGGVMRRLFSKMMDKIINKHYHAKGHRWWRIPFYFEIGKYRFCVYAMGCNWQSCRIKIENTKEWNIVWVIKRGEY